MALYHIGNKMLFREVALPAAVLFTADSGQQRQAGRAKLRHFQPVLQEALHQGRPLGWVLNRTANI